MRREGESHIFHSSGYELIFRRMLLQQQTEGNLIFYFLFYIFLNKLCTVDQLQILLSFNLDIRTLVELLELKCLSVLSLYIISCWQTDYRLLEEIMINVLCLTSSLITCSLSSYRHSRLSPEADTDVFHSTAIFAMDFIINFVKYRNFCDAYVLKNTGAENTQFYISMSTIQNIFINLFSLYISASNNPIFPTQVKFFSPQLSRKAIFMIWTETGSFSWKTFPSLSPSWYSTFRSSKFLNSWVRNISLLKLDLPGEICDSHPSGGTGRIVVVHQNGVKIDWFGDVEDYRALGAREVPAPTRVGAVDDAVNLGLSPPHWHSEHGELWLRGQEGGGSVGTSWYGGS